MKEFLQTNFSGGLNLFDDGVFLGDTEYGLALNVRHRGKYLVGVKGPTELSNMPSGTTQGLFAFDDTLLLVVGGIIYYRKPTDIYWTEITGVSLSPSVSVVYACSVPESTTLASRFAAPSTETTIDSTTVNKGALLSDGSPACIILQDGVTQPVLVKADMSARYALTYELWSEETGREYVPVGKQMCYEGGILYIASPDGLSLYRSLIGRPTDFVINIDGDGKKAGDASTTSYAVSFIPITCIKSLNDGRVFVSTKTHGYFVAPDFNNTIFGEPTFTKTDGFSVGVLNQESVLDILSDTTLVTNFGIRSFNAIRQLKIDGNQSIFSLKVSSLFEGVLQSELAVSTASYQNYGLFAVTTTLGSSVLVYDMLTEKWAGVDFFDIGTIRQLAVTYQQGKQVVFARTDTAVYSLYTSSEYLDCTLITRSLTSASPNSKIKTSNVYLVFDGGEDQHIVSVTEQVDGIAGTALVEKLNLPVLGRTINDPKFNFTGISNTGWKIAFEIKWPGSAKLLQFYLQVDDMLNKSGINQAGQAYKK